MCVCVPEMLLEDDVDHVAEAGREDLQRDVRRAPAPNRRARDSRFVSDEVSRSFPVRFGLRTVPTTRTLCVIIEHARTSPPDTVSPTLKHQRNSQRNSLLDACQRAARGSRRARRGLECREIYIYIYIYQTDEERFERGTRESSSTRPRYRRTFEFLRNCGHHFQCVPTHF